MQVLRHLDPWTGRSVTSSSCPSPLAALPTPFNDCVRRAPPPSLSLFFHHLPRTTKVLVFGTDLVWVRGGHRRLPRGALPAPAAWRQSPPTRPAGGSGGRPSPSPAPFGPSASAASPRSALPAPPQGGWGHLPWRGAIALRATSPASSRGRERSGGGGGPAGRRGAAAVSSSPSFSSSSGASPPSARRRGACRPRPRAPQHFTGPARALRADLPPPPVATSRSRRPS